MKTFLIPMTEQDAKHYCFNKDIEVGLVNSELWEQAEKTKAVDIWEYSEQSALEIKLAAILLENKGQLLSELLGHYFMDGTAVFYKWKTKKGIKYEISLSTDVRTCKFYDEKNLLTGAIIESLDIEEEFLNKLNTL